jgi:hypothetical protein
MSYQLSQNIQILIITILSLFLIYNLYVYYKLYCYLFDEPYYSLCNNTKKYKTILLDGNLDKLNTGDIILFSSYAYDPIFRIFGDYTFSHVGMVVKIDNQLFSLEMTDSYKLNNKIYTNKCLFPLYEKVDKYTGNVFICKLKEELNQNQLNILYDLIKQDFKFYSPIEIYLAMSHNMKFHNKFCGGSLIFYLLQQINIIDKNIKIDNIDINSYLVNLCHQNTIYNYPIEFLCNNSNIKKIYKKTIEYP